MFTALPMQQKRSIERRGNSFFSIGSNYAGCLNKIIFKDMFAVGGQNQWESKLVKDDTFKDYIIDQLRDLYDLYAKGMFGGHGLYQGAKFFGMISKGKLYFKTDDSNRHYYIEQGMKPFRPNEKQTLKNYFEVPPDIIDDSDKLTELARESAKIIK